MSFVNSAAYLEFSFKVPTHLHVSCASNLPIFLNVTLNMAGRCIMSLGDHAPLTSDTTSPIDDMGAWSWGRGHTVTAPT